MPLPQSPNSGNGQPPNRPASPPRRGGLPVGRGLPMEGDENRPVRPSQPRQNSERPLPQERQAPQAPARPRADEGEQRRVRPPQNSSQQPPARPVTQRASVPRQEQGRGQQPPRREQAERPAPQPEENYEENVFSSIPVEEVDNENDFGFADEPVMPAPVKEKPVEVKRVQAKLSHEINFDPNILPRDQSKDIYEENFIDEKNKKLKPFGGRDKKNIKVSEFEDRKNLVTNRKISQYIFIAACVALIGFGAFKTFVPTDSFTAEEIASISAMQNGDTGFPTQKAEGFGKSFIESYTTLSTNGLMNDSLNYFYGGENANRDSGQMTGQKILIGPVTLEANALTSTSGNFVYGVLVETYSTAEVQASEEKLQPTSHWLAFNVNVLFNEATSTFTIAQDSPSLVPYVTPSGTSDLIAAGLGEEIDTVDVGSTVIGYMEAYQASDINNHSRLDQYVTPGAAPETLSGFGGTVAFSDTAENSVQYKVYSNDLELNELKVIVTSTWMVKGEAGEYGSIYDSQSVMTLEKQANGQYLVSKFAPYLFITDDAATEEGE